VTPDYYNNLKKRIIMVGFIVFMIVGVAGYFFLNSYGRLNNPNYADEKGYHIGVLIITGIILFSIIGALIFGGK
jgi:hypothetical protein